MKKWISFLKKEDGVSLTQVCIVLPIIFTLIWGGFQISLFLIVKSKVVDAKTTGLKYMEIHGGLNSTVVDVILREFDNTPADISTLQINGTLGPKNYAEDLYLNIKLDYTLRLFDSFNGPILVHHTFDETGHITSENITVR